jgi:hypothetical protein
MGSGVKTSGSSLLGLFSNIYAEPATTERVHVNPIGAVAPLLEIL